LETALLMIEDDQRLARMVSDYLGEHGFSVDHCEDGATGLAHLSKKPYGALILDVMLPDIDGFEICRRVRAESDVPIIMLTARGDETDRVVGLELGADDYLPKPFGLRELLARLRALLRRGQPARTGQRVPVMHFEDLEIDPESRSVRLQGRECDLTGYQFELLRILAERAGRAVSRERLMELLQGSAYGTFDRSIDVHVSRIRAALGDDPRKPRRILTVRGVGYMFARGRGGVG
jgi:two-component system phosphate regulon response regulator OmpR